MKNIYTVRLTERDVHLLKLFCIFGHLNPKEIAKEVLNVEERYVRRRLRDLFRSGYLVKREKKNGSRKYEIYCPNLKNLATVVDKYTLERGLVAEARQVWDRSYWRHENDLRQWALRIINLYPLAEIDPDYLLLEAQNVSGKYALEVFLQLPDFVVRLPLKPIIAVEIEKSHKTLGRYHKRFLEIMSQQNKSTLYLIENEMVLTAVQAGLSSALLSLQLSAEAMQSKILLCLYSEVSQPEKLKQKIDELLAFQTGAFLGHPKPLQGTG